MTTDQIAGGRHADPEVVHRDLLASLRRRFRHTQPATLAGQVAADPQRTLRLLAAAVADELRATGQAVPVPPPEPSPWRQLRAEAVTGFALVALFVAALTLLVCQATG